MATTISRCDKCAKIPFDTKHLLNGQWSLGRLDQIRKKTFCPLCRIALAAIFDQHRAFGTYSKSDQQLSLCWNPYSGPAGSFSIEGASKHMIGTRICFVNESTPPTVMSGVRSFLTDLAPQLDLKRVRRWISVCVHDHGNHCNPIWSQSTRSRSPIPGLEVLRLVDVVDGCLVEVRGPCKYLALSYVWGGVPNFRLTTSNKSSLMQRGVLQSIWDMLPRTIQDAIDLTKSLEERYLWIDALCLVQNDRADLQKGVGVMDMIYERAIMTIVAAAGDNANASLPGVREDSRFITQHVEQIKPGVKLAVYNDLDHLLRPSTYNRRAWTFQEQLLSRRALFFVDNQVYFRCRESTWSENSVDDFSIPNNEYFDASLLQAVWNLETPSVDYRILLSYYSERALTNQADALSAMAGIIRRLSSKMKCGFFQGVPTAAFDSFMIFTAAHGSLLRRRHGFPSYSWTGWILRFYFPLSVTTNENEWLAHRTWIIWYKRSPLGAVNLVWDPLANESFPANTMEYIGYRKRVRFPHRHMLGFSTSRTTPTEEINFDCTMPSYPLLQFWTLAVYYTISDLQVFTAEAYLLDKQQKRCGSINIDGYEDTTFFERDGTFEFIVLSESDWILSGVSLNDCEYPKDPGSNGWDYYQVLLLEWNAGIAERRGVGVIFQKAVERSCLPGPVWKEIFMA